MSSEQNQLREKLKHKQKAQQSKTSRIEMLVILSLLGIIGVLGIFIWRSLEQRQVEVFPTATPEIVLERSAPMPTEPPAAPQSWYVIVTEVNPITATPLQYVAEPSGNYVQQAPSNAQQSSNSSAPPPAQSNSSSGSSADRQLCGGAGGCREIKTCEQALACLRTGLPIDGDFDGRPCENDFRKMGVVCSL